MNHELSATGETNISALLKSMKPELNDGEYVFCTVDDDYNIDLKKIICSFREKEGITLILEKSKADALHLTYHFVAAWITLTIHSSLEAVGLTAAFAKALGDEGVSCNVVAAFYHDHIFVDKKDAAKSVRILIELSANQQAPHNC